jgi:hypothetical protein
MNLERKNNDICREAVFGIWRCNGRIRVLNFLNTSVLAFNASAEHGTGAHHTWYEEHQTQNAIVFLLAHIPIALRLRFTTQSPLLKYAFLFLLPQQEECP